MRDAFERLHAKERETGGHEVHVEPGARRISNIFNKTAAFDKCLWIPEVLAVSAYALGEIKVHGANLRDPVKGYGHQDLHVDVPKRFTDDWWVVNSMVMFDDMDARQRADPHRARIALLGADQRALCQYRRLGAHAARAR